MITERKVKIALLFIAGLLFGLIVIGAYAKGRSDMMDYLAKCKDSLRENVDELYQFSNRLHQLNDAAGNSAVANVDASNCVICCKERTSEDWCMKCCEGKK